MGSKSGRLGRRLHTGSKDAVARSAASVLIAGADALADIGHIHLNVADLERSIAFYTGPLGMKVKHRADGVALFAFGEYHHHVAVNTWHSGDHAIVAGSVGLHHFAVRYATRRGLAAAVQRLLQAGVPIDSTSDSGGVAESIYLRDPDDIGIELTWDRPPEQRRQQPERAVDLAGLLSELEPTPSGLGAGSTGQTASLERQDRS